MVNHLTILREMSTWGLSAIYDKLRVNKIRGTCNYLLFTMTDEISLDQLLLVDGMVMNFNLLRRL